MNTRTYAWIALATAATLGATGCTDSTTSLEPETELLSVTPRGGEVNVDTASQVVVTFSHAMDAMMTEYAALHEGDVNGPEVPGTWAMSGDSTAMTFTPEQPLAPATDYTIHLGGGMMDAEGHPVGMGTYGEMMGGMWASQSMMMGGGMMGGGMHEHMSEGWEHPENGSYGMIFTFTTSN